VDSGRGQNMNAVVKLAVPSRASPWGPSCQFKVNIIIQTKLSTVFTIDEQYKTFLFARLLTSRDCADWVDG
jgi:hypothetical protein